MNTDTKFPIELDSLIAATRTPVEDDGVQQAADQFREKLATRKPRKNSNRMFRRIGSYAFGLAALALASLMIGPHWFSDSSGAALAKALRWFETYTNMYVRFVNSGTSGRELTVEMWLARDGSERRSFEIGGFESIRLFDPSTETVYTLLPGKRFTQRPVSDEERAEGASPATLLLDGLIEFEGEAVLIEEERNENGRVLEGMQLISDDEPPVERTLWVDRESKMPVRFIVETPASGEIVFDLDFDLDLVDDFFEVPDDYVEMGDEGFQ